MEYADYGVRDSDGQFPARRGRRVEGKTAEPMAATARGGGGGGEQQEPRGGGGRAHGGRGRRTVLTHWRGKKCAERLVCMRFA